MKRLKPFISYYGSKYRLAPLYPKPLHDMIVEPFAGSACYSLLYPDKQVILNDANPVIIGVWDYLIEASESEIGSLPVNIETTQGLKLPQEAKWLIGFWLHPASTMPYVRGNSYLRNASIGNASPNRVGWTIGRRDIIVTQLQFIRHWKTRCVDYSKLTYADCTWFVDPPYFGQPGRMYPYQVPSYNKLSEWCKTKNEQVIACDQNGADWLPFRQLTEHIGHAKNVNTEVMWTNRKLWD